MAMTQAILSSMLRAFMTRVWLRLVLCSPKQLSASGTGGRVQLLFVSHLHQLWGDGHVRVAVAFVCGSCCSVMASR